MSANQCIVHGCHNSPDKTSKNTFLNSICNGCKSKIRKGLGIGSRAPFTQADLDRYYEKISKKESAKEYINESSSSIDIPDQQMESNNSASQSDSIEDNQLNESVSCEEKENHITESIPEVINETAEDEIRSNDSVKADSENNIKEMESSKETAVISPVMDDSAASIEASSNPEKVPASDKSIDDSASNDTPAPEKSKDSEVTSAFASLSKEDQDAIFDEMDDGDSPDNTNQSSTSAATPSKDTTSVATPAAPAKKSSFNFNTSIKFANIKQWITNIFSPIGSSISIQGDNEFAKKQRFAFLNKILPIFKAFHKYISSIEKQQDYYNFLIPFECYANHRIDSKERDKFIENHKELCYIPNDDEGKIITPFTGCGFDLCKTNLALFDFDFKTIKYTYENGNIVGEPNTIKTIEDTTIIEEFFEKLFGVIDRATVFDVITKSNGHHIYCRWDGSLYALESNTVDKGCCQCIGKSSDKIPSDGEYMEYYCELDIKIPNNKDKTVICVLPGTVCYNKLGEIATYKLDPRSTESDINKLLSFKEVSDKIASVYSELDYMVFNKNKYNSLSSTDKFKAILRNPETTEEEKMDAEALAWLDSPYDNDDEDLSEIREDIKCSPIVDDENTIVFTDELIAAIIEGFKGITIHGHHSVKANKDNHIHAEPSRFALKKAIYMLTTDANIRDKLLDGIYNSASLTDNAKNGWNSNIPFDDKEWDSEMQRKALVIISSWIRSKNEAFYNAELANKLYRPGKYFFDDRTHMFTWQEFQERMNGNVYKSVSALMYDLSKVLAINTCGARGKGYFIKKWYKGPNLGNKQRYNDFIYESCDGQSVASVLEAIMTIPTTAAEKEKQRAGKRKIEDTKDINIAALLKKNIYRMHLASFRGIVLWSNDKLRLSRFKPPAGNYNREIVELFINLMKSRVVHPKAWEEEFASHAYRIQKDGNVFIPKYFVHVDPNGHAGKSFNAAAFSQVYGERFSNAGATVANMVDTYNSWLFELLYVNFEEVQYSNGRGFDIRDKLKQLTTKNASKRDMYKVTETAEHKAIISINTNQKDLYGLINSDPADLRRLVIIEFKEATREVIENWEKVIDVTINNPDFGYSLFHYMCYEYKIPDWYKYSDHCTPDIRDEYITRSKGENENQIMRWIGWLMSKPIADGNDDTISNRDSLLLNKVPEAYENWHNDWFLHTKLSKGVGEVAVQSKFVLWKSYEKFCDGDRKYNQTHLFKDLKEVYGFTEHRVHLYGPKSSKVHSLYIPIDKLYGLRSKYGGLTEYNEADDDVLDIITSTEEQK